MKKTVSITAGVAVVTLALTLAGAAPAFGWGGPKNFNSGNCNGYSIKSNSAGNAGADTVDVYGAGYSLRVAFHGGTHTDIAPVTGTNSVVSYISQSVVNTYDVTGGTHTCGSSSTTT